MKNIILLSLVLLSFNRSQAQLADSACSDRFETKATNQAVASLFPFTSYLADGMADYGHAGLDLHSGMVVAVNKGDFYVARTNKPDVPQKFFVRNNSGDYPENENTQGGMMRVQGANLQGGIVCPERGYSVHWFEVKEGDLICTRARDGKTYGILQVNRICSQGIAFSWNYNSDGSRSFGTIHEIKKP